MTRVTKPGEHLAALSLWFPMALALSYVLISFAATPVPASGLMRPLIVGIGATALLQGLLWIVLRRRYAAAVLTGLIVLVSSAAWLALGIAAAGVLWWFIVSRLRRAQGARPLRMGFRDLVRLFGGVLWFMALVAVVPAASILLSGGGAPDVQRLGDSVDHPDITVVLLDGYPRADALARMGHDNSEFLAELDERGFATAQHSRANYTSTWAALASIFNARYLEDVATLDRPYPVGAADQYRALMRLIDEAPSLDPLRASGYEVVTMPPTLEGAQLTSADRTVSAPQMTAFELSLIQRSPLGYLILTIDPSIAYGQHAERTEATLRLTAEEIARSADAPRFVFSHVTSPHPPLVTDAMGDHVAPPDCFPGCSMYVFGSDEDWTRLPGQVSHLNGLVLEMVDSILAVEPDSTIVLLSDHGMRPPDGTDAEIFRNLFSIRTAGAPIDVPDDIQPFQLLPLLTGEEVRSQPFRGWVSADERPLILTEYVGPVP